MKAEPSQWKTLEEIVGDAQKLGFSALADAWRQTYLDESKHRNIQIAFFGEFNHGKSSLINAIAGFSILPSGMTPTTQIDTYIRFHAEKTQVTAWCGARQLCTWKFGDWKRHAIRMTAECLKKYTPDRIDIALDSDYPIPNCIFIDTPGLNEASLARESGLISELSHADIAVFVLDADQALTRTEANVLEVLARTVPESRRILIINKCDRLTGDEWLEICAHVENSVSPVLGDGRFYMVSAHDSGIGDWEDFTERLAGEAAGCLRDHDETYAERTQNLLLPILRGLRPICRAFASLDKDLLRSTVRQWSDAEPAPRRTAADLIHEIDIETERLKTQIQHDMMRFEQNFLHAAPRELDKAGIGEITGYFEDFIDEEYAKFATGQAEQLLDALNALYLYAWEKLSGECLPEGIEPDSFHRFEDIFENVEKLIHHPVPTGAFDATTNGIASALIRPMPFVRLERPIREALLGMSNNAISRRCDSYRAAFAADIDMFHDELSGLIREMGRQLRVHIAEHARFRLKTPWEDSEN